jgi:hypothetical protein
MPAKRKTAGSETWGIRWQDVADATDAASSHYGCVVEYGVVFLLPYKGALHTIPHVTAHILRRRGKADEVHASGTCPVGGNRGAASMCGAFMRALQTAIDNYELRMQDKRYDRDTAATPLPGFER